MSRPCTLEKVYLSSNGTTVTTAATSCGAGPEPRGFIIELNATTSRPLASWHPATTADTAGIKGGHTTKKMR